MGQIVGHAAAQSVTQTAHRWRPRWRDSRGRVPVVYAAVTALVATLGIALAPATVAQDAPGDGGAVDMDGTDGTVDTDGTRPSWANPEARSADPDNGVSVEIISQQPAVLGFDGALDLTVRISNSSDRTVDDLQLRTQRQEAVDDSSGVSTSMLSNQGAYPWVGPFANLDGSIDPGEDRQYRLTVPVDDRSGSLPGLGVTDSGVYPVMLNLNADYGEDGTSFLAAARTTVTVRDDGDDQNGTDNSRPSGLTMLWPLSSATSATPGQVGDAPDPNTLYLPDETLAEELATGGRLSTLLTSYRDALSGTGGNELREASCIAIDPDLLETVDRMTGGYRVADEAPSPVEEPVRLRDRWTDDSEGTTSESGTGAEAAADWLDELRELTEGHCIVPLPFGGADPNVISDIDDPWLTELSTRGAATVEDVLGTDAADGVVIPGSGYLEESTVAALGEAERETPLSTLVADNTVQSTTSSPGSTAGVVTLPGGTRALRFPAELGTALAATGDTPSTSAYGNPGNRRTLDDDTGPERMAAAVGVLDLELRGAGSTASGANVLAVPPVEWTVDGKDAATWLSAVGRYLSDGSARPVTFGAALRGVAEPGTTVAPAVDPAPVSAAEREDARELTGDLHQFTRIMVEDENLALTPQIFTRPMFDDILRSVSTTRRHAQSEHRATVRASEQRRETVQALESTLRSSVSLLPPGSVFTRTSDGAPLIIVARNGLPLPVRVRVDYESDSDVTLDTPGVERIPAQGSVTLQMTATTGSGNRNTDLTMTLKTPDDQQISDPVTVRLASGPGGMALAVVVGVMLVFGLFAVSRVTKRRRELAGKRERTR